MTCAYRSLTRRELEQILADEEQKLAAYRAQGLSLDMSRGKPSPEQIDISRNMLDVLTHESELSDSGIRADNYGEPSGLPSARELAAEILGTTPDNTIVNGSSSLKLMYDTLVEGYIHGFSKEKPMCTQKHLKWLCPAPGYDRHFAITESLGFENIAIPIVQGALDIETIKHYVEEDEHVKGIWLNPKYQNPLGFTCTDDEVRALVRMNPKARDFRIFWDNAYALHGFRDTDDELLNIFDALSEEGVQNRVFAFGSFAKITFPSSAIAYMAADTDDMNQITQAFNVSRVSPEKLSQLAHIRFFGNLDAVKDHMKRHAHILRPRFDMVEERLSKGLGGLEIADWTHPRGGYFVTLTVMEGCAKNVVETMKKTGVTLTNAGAMWPYGKDPYDATIRLAPSYPTLDELKSALDILCCVVKVESLRKLLRA